MLDTIFDPETDEELDEEMSNAEDGQEMFEHFRLTADKGQSLMRVDKYLASHLENTSRHRIQLAIKEEYIKVNGEIVKDTLVNFADGTYRYFDDNGYLVRDTFNDDNTFDKIVSFVDGIDGERGAIKEAVLDTAEGIFSVKDAALQKGWGELQS